MGTDIVDYDQLFPGRFLKAGEFKGRDVTLTIATVVLEDLPQEKGGDKARGIIGFKETKKGLVLNKTNGECFKAMFGRKPPDWIGRKVTLWPAPYDNDIAIRVKGSPELKEPIEFELKLHKKRPVTMIMVPTGKPKAADSAPAEEGAQ